VIIIDSAKHVLADVRQYDGRKVWFLKCRAENCGDNTLKLLSYITSIFLSCLGLCLLSLEFYALHINTININLWAAVGIVLASGGFYAFVISMVPTVCRRGHDIATGSLQDPVWRCEAAAWISHCLFVDEVQDLTLKEFVHLMEVFLRHCTNQALEPETGQIEARFRSQPATRLFYSK
jgi:hypothetical protein